ncbi:MAG: C39 family peptidase, partial [Chloroflexota bacterium]
MIAMKVPYISQWDATAKLSRGDCGIVAACMCAQWKGIRTTPDEMLRLAGLPIGRHTYDFPEVIRAASAVGVRLKYFYPATWSIIRAELKATRPVISLLRYGKISNNQDDFDGSHFWTCVGFDDEHVYVNDPNFWGDQRERGAMRQIPLVEFKQAIGPALLPTGNKAY